MQAVGASMRKEPLCNDCENTNILIKQNDVTRVTIRSASGQRINIIFSVCINRVCPTRERDVRAASSVLVLLSNQ